MAEPNPVSTVLTPSAESLTESVDELRVGHIIEASGAEVGTITSLHALKKELRFGRNGVWMAGTDGGMDVIVEQFEPKMYSNQTGEALEQTGWVKSLSGYRQSLLRPEFYLGGLLSQRERSYQSQDGEHYNLTVLTSPDGFNGAMVRLSKKPGEDSFKMDSIAGGIFSAREHVEAAANLTGLAALDNLAEIQHDRLLADHVAMWWSTPTDVALRLQENAQDTLLSDDEERVKDFSWGLDRFQLIPTEIIKKTYAWINDTEIVHKTVAERMKSARTFFEGQSFSGLNRTQDQIDSGIYGGTNDRLAVLTLIKTGFLDIPIKKRAYDEEPYKVAAETMQFNRDADGNVDPKQLHHIRYIYKSIRLAYAKNILEIFQKVDELTGPPEQAANKDRAEFITQFHTYLDEQIALPEGVPQPLQQPGKSGSKLLKLLGIGRGK